MTNPKPTPVWRNPSFWASFWAAIAAWLSLVTVIDTHNSAKNAYKLQLNSELRQILVTFLEAYRETSEKNRIGILSSIDAYNAASMNEKIQAQIVDGLLVSVVGAMYHSDDPRADTWASFIKTIPGPLAEGYPLETYATHLKTKEEIAKARRAITSEQTRDKSK
jgi:hypothetical protein